MNNDDNLDLLDLDDNASLDTLPDAAPYAAPRPKKPWLLLALGLLVIVLATYIIIRTIGGDSSSSIDVDLDAPAVIVDGTQQPMPDINVPAQPVNVAPVAPVQELPKPKPQPVVKPEPQPVAPVVEQSVGTPVRVIEDRKDVVFNPEKPVQKQPTAKPAAKPVVKPAAKPAAKKAAPKQNVAPKGSWYVQFGSYSTRALAESAQRQITAAHRGLFAGKQFVILAAVLPNGTTTYRLRIAFANSGEANGFCQNAKSDGLDCYVAK